MGIPALHFNTHNAKQGFLILNIIIAEGKVMDWQNCMNQALGYIEDNLADDIDCRY